MQRRQHSKPLLAQRTDAIYDSGKVFVAVVVGLARHDQRETAFGLALLGHLRINPNPIPSNARLLVMVSRS